MWEKIKSYFKKPAQVEEVVVPKTLLLGEVSTSPATLIVPNTTFRRGMWAVLDGHVGIIHEFKGNDIMFHHVNRETGWTTKEEQVSALRVRQAKFDEIPPCRWGLSREDAVRLGYGS